MGAWMGTDDVSLRDLYSCFPIAVFNIADNFDLLDAPGGLTVTGGLPFFGGAGNNYSMHAIAQMVRLLRERPKDVGVVGANGGYMSKYSVGLYTAKPSSWRPFDSAILQKELDSADPAPVVETYAGEGKVETYTIDYADPAKPRGLVIGQTAGGERFVAVSEDAAIVEQMIENDPLGVSARAGPGGGGRNLIVGLG
jgi:acetyl-CoA C-acetyltransferase